VLTKHILEETVLLAQLDAEEEEVQFNDGRSSRNGWHAFITKLGNLLVEVKGFSNEASEFLESNESWT
jgi:hypothetical protein